MIRYSLILLLIFTFSLQAQESDELIDYGTEFKKAKVKYESGDYQGAINDFTALLPKMSEVTFEDSSIYMDIYTMMGDSYLSLNKTKEAESFFLKVSNYYANPANKLSYVNQKFAMVNLSLMYVQGKSLTKSENMLRQTLSAMRASNDEKSQDYIDLVNQLKVIYWGQYNLKAVDSCLVVLRQLNLELYGESSLPYAHVLKSTADIQREQSKFNEAVENYKKVKKVFKDSLGSGSKDYLGVLNTLAHMYQKKEQFSEAEMFYSEMASAYRENKGDNSIEYSNCVYQLSMIYKSQGYFSKAEDLLQRTLKAYKNSVGEKHINYILTMQNLADMYRKMELYEKAENYYSECSRLLLESQGEKNKNYADLMNNMALLSVDRSRYEEAEQRYLLSLKITKEILNEKHQDYAHSLQNLALLYKNIGRFEEAEPLFKKAIEIQKEVLGEKHSDYAESLNNFADFYDELGNYKESEKLYQQALAINKAIYGENHPEYANVLNNLGTSYEASGQIEKAEKSFIQALSIIKATLGEDHQQYALTLDNLANLYIIAGKFDKAAELNKKDQEIIKRKLGPNHPNYAFSLSTQGRILENAEKYDEAEKVYLEVERIRKASLGDHHFSYTHTLVDLARIYTVKNDYNKAYAYWIKALQNYNEDIRLRFSAMSENEREEFYNLIREHFEQFNSFALMFRDKIPDVAGTLYNMQLETKSLLFRASNKMRQRILASNNPKLIEDFNTWLQKKELLAKYLSLPKDQVDKNLDSLEQAVNQLEKSLETASAGFKDANDSKFRTWQDVQSQLKVGEAAVEMIFFNSFKFVKGGTFEKWGDSSKQAVNYVALVLKPESKMPEFVLLKNSSDLQYRLINYYRNVVKFKVKDELCYDNFWKPIQDQLPGINKIFFSPAGVYSQINLLTMFDNTTQKYLIEEKDIELVSNTWDLTIAKGSPSASKKAALFGNPNFGESHSPGDGERGARLAPLPGTAVEVSKINTTLSSKQFAGNMLTSNLATEENLKQLRDTRILHIATHGYFKKDLSINKEGSNNGNNEVNPLLKSGIYLANSIGERKGNEDGILSALEAMNLNLDNTDLVVLSACETGLGTSSNGEAVSGLQKAFRVAGAQTVILSLWKVDDAATQKLMTYFYEELVKTGNIGNVRAAFRVAQLKIKTEYNDPKYWGAFVVVGN
jgi:CHAT domain-containing protein/Flp pilus assembly protein TadD